MTPLPELRQMQETEKLGALLQAAAERFASHDSHIGAQMAANLRAIDPPPLGNSGHQVAACSDLDTLCQSVVDPLVDLISRCHPMLRWRQPGFGKLQAKVADRIAVTEIVGPDGMIHHPGFRFGLLLQQAGVDYPTHRHAAEELYLVLSGSAGWAVDGQDYVTHAPEVFIHHHPWQPHMMLTRAQPMLTMWGWTGDIGSGTYAV
ncbi:MAG: dimethylsulfonioproprionate lyase family protein [Rhodobacterales bacterium]|nr:dimethylsulfonioproprionate lyase family protein [Pseudomonadota bacterium]MDA1287563.1 dimethylsulfonioproprionate lyase family protein [Pseudomonadota bacterium]